MNGCVDSCSDNLACHFYCGYLRLQQVKVSNSDLFVKLAIDKVLFVISSLYFHIVRGDISSVVTKHIIRIFVIPDVMLRVGRLQSVSAYLDYGKRDGWEQRQ